MKPWTWRVLRPSEATGAFADEWHALAEATKAKPLARPVWAATYSAAFEKPAAPIFVHALYSPDRLVAVLPLAKSTARLPVWASLSNAHAPYVAYATLEPGPLTGAEILRHLFEDAVGVDLERVYADDPLVAALETACRSSRIAMRQEEADREVCFELAAVVPGSEPEERLKRHRRSVRQLEKLGRVELRTRTGRDGLQELLGECFELEKQGWKGESGSPMASRPDTLRFYTDLAHAAADQGFLALYSLHLDGRLVAFDYALRTHDRGDSLKCGYAPDLARCSPGNVLSYLTLGSEIERGLGTYHYGRFDDWKQRWSTRLDPLIRLRIYRPGLSGLLLQAPPAIRAGLRRVGWLRMLASRVRTARERLKRG